VSVVVDDVLLLRALARRPPPELAGEPTATTGVWYFRLGQALRPGGASGHLSRRIAALPLPQRSAVRAAFDELPAGVGLLSLRRLVPVIRRLDPHGRLNLLAAEALAAAYVLEAGVVVTTDAPLLQTACAETGIPYRVLPL